ncbi:hypothetical protein ACFQ6V_09140 [Streptomyces roseifaciens]
MSEAAAGPVFHGPVHNSQIAWGSQEVSQVQNLSPPSAWEPSASAVRELLANLHDLGLEPGDERTLRQHAEDFVGEAGQQTPDAGRLQRLAQLIRMALTPVVAGALSGAGSGAGELVRTVVTDLQHVLP